LSQIFDDGISTPIHAVAILPWCYPQC